MTTLPSAGELPEELVAEAREIATAWCAHVLVDGAAEVIARALMAARKDERERAARIARRKIVGGYMHGAPEYVDGDAIALAILNSEQKP